MFVGLQFPSENEARLLTKIYKIMSFFFQRGLLLFRTSSYIVIPEPYIEALQCRCQSENHKTITLFLTACLTLRTEITQTCICSPE